MQHLKYVGISLCLLIFFGCYNDNKPQSKQPADREERADELSGDLYLNRTNIVLQGQIFQYPELLTISGNEIVVSGHETESKFWLDKSGFAIKCQEKVQFKVEPLVSWDIQKNDYLLPSYCFKGDSLVLRSKPRLYRGGKPKAWIDNKMNKVSYQIDTHLFNDIISVIQVKKGFILLLFDAGIQYGDEEYSFKYAIIKL